MVRRIVAIASVVVMAGPTVANAQVSRLDPVVVTATKTETPQERLGASVTVVTEEEINAGRYQSVGEVLRQIPGVDVQQQGSLGKNTTIRIRGAGADEVQVLVDGMRVKAATTGDFNFSNLALSDIERIEVVRGPQSSLYGADAIGGVVNIITKRGRGPLSARVGVDGGNHATNAERASVSGSVDRFDYSLGASRYRSGGQFKNDLSEQYGVSGRFGVTLPNRGTAWLSGRYAELKTGLPIDDPTIPTPPFFRLDPDAHQRNRLATLGAQWDQGTADWHDFRVRFGQLWNDRSFEDPLTRGLDRRRTVSEVDNRRREVELVNTLRPVDWDTLVLGAEHRDEWADSVGSFRRSVRIDSAFVQNELRFFDRLFLSGGARLEDHETFGTETTPRAGLVYLVREWDTKLRGSWSRGFRAPTLNDLFFPGFGNPNLQPERTESWDAGLEQKRWRRRIRFGLSYFHTSAEDLIQNVRVAGVLTPQNVGRARIDGVEFAAGVEPLDGLALTLNYTFTDGQDLTHRLPLRRLPRHRWNMGVSWDPIRALNVFAQAHVVTRQFEDAAFPRNPGYHRLDAGASWTIVERRPGRPRLSTFVRFQNLTDERYFETFGFPAPRFTVLGGVEAVY